MLKSRQTYLSLSLSLSLRKPHFPGALSSTSVTSNTIKAPTIGHHQSSSSSSSSAMASTFLPKHTFLFSLLHFFSTPSFSTASPSKTSSLAADVSSRTQAEKLIRGFNLFPRETVDIRAGDVDSAASLASGGKIVESRLNLPILGNSGSSIQDLGHHAGYYRLPHSHAARMFYFFFESRSSADDPVVIWLTGGPGCSSELALFYENGPFHIANNLSLVWNDYGWDKVSEAGHSVPMDQPKVALEMIQSWMVANVTMASAHDRMCPYPEIEMQDVYGESSYPEIQMQDVYGESSYPEIQMEDVFEEESSYSEIQMQDVYGESSYPEIQKQDVFEENGNKRRRIEESKENGNKRRRIKESLV